MCGSLKKSKKQSPYPFEAKVSVSNKGDLRQYYRTWVDKDIKNGPDTPNVLKARWRIFIPILEMLEIEVFNILYNPGNIGKRIFSTQSYPGNSGSYDPYLLLC